MLGSLKVPRPLHFSLHGDFLLEVGQSDLNSMFLQDFETGIPFCTVDCWKFLGERRPLCSWDTSGSEASRGPVSQGSLSHGSALTLTSRQLSNSVQRWGPAIAQMLPILSEFQGSTPAPHNENKNQTKQNKTNSRSMN